MVGQAGYGHDLLRQSRWLTLSQPLACMKPSEDHGQRTCHDLVEQPVPQHAGTLVGAAVHVDVLVAAVQKAVQGGQDGGSAQKSTVECLADWLKPPFRPSSPSVALIHFQNALLTAQ